VSNDPDDKREVCCSCPIGGTCPDCDVCLALSPDETGRVGAIRRPGR
jgi:hypothetical protein